MEIFHFRCKNCTVCCMFSSRQCRSAIQTWRKKNKTQKTRRGLVDRTPKSCSTLFQKHRILAEYVITPITFHSLVKGEFPRLTLSLSRSLSRDGPQRGCVRVCQRRDVTGACPSPPTKTAERAGGDSYPRPARRETRAAWEPGGAHTGGLL